jgi:XRE family transcriptional regulator, aerobic/anaerobic benzoate catabolism transcriptional regulator
MHDMTDDPAGRAAPAEAEAGFLQELGRRVRAMRAIRGMSRKVLSAASGLSERYIAQLEGGRGNVSILLLRRVSAAMGVRLEDLLRDGPANSDRTLIRDLLQDAPVEKLAEIKAMLAAAGDERRLACRVALIGLRGAGKSTLGRMAAADLGWPFVELNREIEASQGLSVSDIFAIHGQEGYRRMELSALRELIERPGPMILATGGGIVAETRTFELLLSSFFTVWLMAAPEEHMARVRAQGDFRPMGDDRSAMRELRAILQGREPLYARARIAVDTRGQPLAESAERLKDAIVAAGGLDAAAAQT